jgi:hypothetical protein
MAGIADPSTSRKRTFALNVADRWTLTGSMVRLSGPGTVMTFSRR